MQFLVFTYEALTVDEKMKRRQELQQELNLLKTKLRMSEAEASKESQKEALADEQSAVKGTEADGESRTAQAVKEKAAEAKEKEEAAKAEKKEEQLQSLKENVSESAAEKAGAQKRMRRRNVQSSRALSLRGLKMTLDSWMKENFF